MACGSVEDCSLEKRIIAAGSTCQSSSSPPPHPRSGLSKIFGRKEKAKEGAKEEARESTDGSRPLKEDEEVVTSPEPELPSSVTSPERLTSPPEVAKRPPTVREKPHRVHDASPREEGAEGEGEAPRKIPVGVQGAQLGLANILKGGIQLPVLKPKVGGALVGGERGTSVG